MVATLGLLLQPKSPRHSLNFEEQCQLHELSVIVYIHHSFPFSIHSIFQAIRDICLVLLFFLTLCWPNVHLPTILYLVDAPMAVQPEGPQHVFIGAHFQLSPIVELNLALHVAQQLKH